MKLIKKVTADKTKLPKPSVYKGKKEELKTTGLDCAPRGII